MFERTTAPSRTRSPLARAVVAGGFILTSGLAESLYGDISGQTVVVGNAVFIQTANGWIIKPSNGAVIEYSAFGVNANETIQFIQTSANARVLNRVLGDFPTNIDGRLLSNGIVYLTNPAGVFIGPSGVVNVGGIYAAAGSMSNADFAAGLDSFTSMSGRVENRGEVIAKSVAALMGTSIVNTGSIKTGPDGLTALVASTGSVRFSEAGIDPKVFVDVAIESDPLSNPASDVGVLNTGSVRAGAGGQILLGAGDVYSVAIRNTASSTVRTPGGLVLMKGNVVRQEGSIDGERLTVEAERFELASDMRFDRMRINADVMLHDDVTLRGENGGLAEWIYIGGRLNSTAGDLHSLSAQAAESIFHMDVGEGAGRLGSLVVGGNGYFNGDVTTEGDITIAGKTLFNNGNRAQSMVSAGGTIDFGDLVVKLGQSLTLGAPRIEFGGDVLAVGDLTIGTAPGTEIVLDGAGDQRVISYTRLEIDGDVTKTSAGALHLVAPTIGTSGDITTSAGDLWLWGATVFDGVGDQHATAAGGDLHLVDDVRKTTAGTLTLAGDRIFVSKDIASLAGGLALDGDTEFNGIGAQEATAGDGTLQASGDVLKSSGGSLTLFGQSILLGGDVTTSSGDLTLDGDVLFDGAGDQRADAAGSLTVTGDAVKSGVGDLALLADGQLTLGGDVRALQGDLTLEADSIELDAAGEQVIDAAGTLTWDAPMTKAQGDLRLVGGERIDIGGDVTLDDGRLRFVGPVLLRIDTAVAAERVEFDGSIDGTYALVVTADERITFGGDIGQDLAPGAGPSAGLRSLVLQAGEFVEFDGSAVRIVEGISFNAGDAANGTIPAVATIGASGDIRFDVGEFTMGPRQKFTVLGTLRIEAGAGTVTLGDVNVLEDLIVNAAEIRIRSRDSGPVLTSNGTISDLGADLLAGGRFSFSSVPIILGDGLVRFGSLIANADGTGALAGFSLSLLTDPFDAAALFQGGVYFDATIPLPPPAPPELVAGASPATFLAERDPDGEDERLTGDAALLRENERLALDRALGPDVALRRQLPVELERGGAGTIAFDGGAVAEATRVAGARTEVALPRISRQSAVRFLSASARLEALSSTEGGRARAQAMLARLESAPDAAAIRSIAVEVRDSGDATALGTLRAIAATIAWGESLGLTDEERRDAGSAAVPFPQHRVMALLGSGACTLTRTSFPEDFWLIVDSPTALAER